MGIWDWHDRRLAKGVRKLFKENLCLVRDDRLLILSDEEKERVGELLFHYGSAFVSNAAHYTYPTTGKHGVEPPEGVWVATFGREFVEELKSKGLFNKLLSKELTEADREEVKEILLETTSPNELPTAIVAVNRYSLSHTFYRKLCTHFLSVRFASMPLFEPFMFYTSLQADWNRVERLSKRVAQLLTEAKRATLTAPNGTNLTLSLEGREGLADTGRLCKPGDFGNLPA